MMIAFRWLERGYLGYRPRQKWLQPTSDARSAIFLPPGNFRMAGYGTVRKPPSGVFRC